MSSTTITLIIIIWIEQWVDFIITCKIHSSIPSISVITQTGTYRLLCVHVRSITPRTCCNGVISVTSVYSHASLSSCWVSFQSWCKGPLLIHTLVNSSPSGNSPGQTGPEDHMLVVSANNTLWLSRRTELSTPNFLFKACWCNCLLTMYFLKKDCVTDYHNKFKILN